MTDSLVKIQGFARRPVILAGLLAVLIAGCGKVVPTGTVRGKVLFEDAPYTDAAVVFLSPQTGQASSANIQSDGTFQLADPLPVGSYTVFLAPKSLAPADASAEPAPVSIDESVPEKYWNEATSDIKAQIAEGENDVTVQLKK